MAFIHRMDLYSALYNSDMPGLVERVAALERRVKELEESLRNSDIVITMLVQKVTGIEQKDNVMRRPDGTPWSQPGPMTDSPYWPDSPYPGTAQPWYQSPGSTCKSEAQGGLPQA